MSRKIKASVLRATAKVFDRWLAGLRPGERIYVLEKINTEILNRLTQAEESRQSSRTGARLEALKRLYARETENLTRADQVEFFRVAAANIGVESFCASGSLGVFQGSTRDYAVLARYAEHGTYDIAYQTLMIDHLFAKGHGTLVDIGANIGLTSIPIARERMITCFAFEPEPRSYLYLRQNVLANAVEPFVNCVNLALFSEEGSLQFELADGNMGDHRVRTSASSGQSVSLLHEETRKTIEVKASTLDVVFGSKVLEPPTVVKIDAQGSEVRVLRGADDFLRRVDYLISELDPYMLNRIGDSVDAYIDTIVGFRYGALAESPDDLSRTRPRDPPQLEPIQVVIDRIRAFARKASGPSDYANLILSKHLGFDSP